MVTVELVKTDGSVKEYTVKSSSLENELGETVSVKDLFYGNKLIWKYIGCPSLETKHVNTAPYKCRFYTRMMYKRQVIQIPSQSRSGNV